MPMLASPSLSKTHTLFHVDAQGAVWRGREGMPTRASESLATFLDAVPRWRCDAVRILGTAENAPLILAAQASRAAGLLGSVQLGTPLLAGVERERANPVRALLRAQEAPQRPQCAGGWHELTHLELPSYRLAAAIYAARPREEWLELYMAHPLRARLDFIPHDPMTMAGLVGLVRDPRWYVAPARPERISKLAAYLGVDPATVSAVADGTVVTRTQHRYALVREAWFEPAMMQRHACNFLGRTFLEHNDPLKAELRASRKFVAFLRHTWMDLLAQTSEPLFEPSFLLDAEAAEAYQAFCASTNSIIGN